MALPHGEYSLALCYSSVLNSKCTPLMLMNLLSISTPIIFSFS